MPGEERPNIAQIDKDRWVSSQNEDLEFTEDDVGHEVVIKFIK